MRYRPVPVDRSNLQHPINTPKIIKKAGFRPQSTFARRSFKFAIPRSGKKKKHVFVRCRPLPLICPNSCEKTHTPKPNAPASYPLQQCACRTEATTIGAFSLQFFHMGSPLGGTRLSCRRFNSARTHRVVRVLLPLWADYAL